jgi:4-amino-4-deoxy-L-arabinose transferase-like glycosyltransferase
MIYAGPNLHFQHYRPISQLIDNSPGLLVILIVQTIIVGTVFIRRRRAIKVWLLNSFKLWQLAVIFCFMALASTALSRDLFTYFSELLFATYLQVLVLVNVIFVAWDLPDAYLNWMAGKYRFLFSRDPRAPNEPVPLGTKIFPVIAVVWVFLFTAITSYFVYEDHPHVPDEVIYIYQAKYFASGLLKTPAYPVPEAFSLYLVPYLDNKWYSPFPPGWPALLSLGVMAGIPWLVNPLLAGLCVWLAYLLVRGLYDLRTAYIVIGLLMISPWFLFMGMNFMSHTFMLTMTLTASLAVVKARETGRAFWGLIAGAAVGVLSLIRPLDGLVMAVLLGVWALGVGGKRLRLVSLVAYGIGVLMFSAINLPYNKAITGDFFKFPLNAYYEKYFGPKVYALGFGPDRGLSWAIDPYPGYSPLEAAINGALNTYSINVELFGWGASSLLFVAIFLVSGRYKQNDVVILTMVLTVIGLYSLFWYSGGPDFGARYWYLMIIPLILLSVRGIGTVISKFDSEPTDGLQNRSRVFVVVSVLCLLTVVNYYTWRMFDKYYRYLRMSPEIEQLTSGQGFEHGIILIQGDSHPDYASAWINNPLDPTSASTVYALDLSAPIRVRILDSFPGRPVWIVAGPSVTQAGYQIVEGPISPEEAQIRFGY